MTHRDSRRVVTEVKGDSRAPDLISAVVRQGRLDQGDAALFLRVSSVTARKTFGELVRLGFLTSDSPKTSVLLAFPLDYRQWLFQTCSPVSRWGETGRQGSQDRTGGTVRCFTYTFGQNLRRALSDPLSEWLSEGAALGSDDILRATRRLRAD